VTKSVLSGTAQLWYRLYKGKAGTVQWGASYAYVYKSTWPGLGPTSPATVGTLANPLNGNLRGIPGMVHPKSIQNIGMMAFRYYIP
jgi:hypothetical protein